MKKSERPCFSEIYEMDAKNEMKTLTFSMNKTQTQAIKATKLEQRKQWKSLLKQNVVHTYSEAESYYQNN